MYPILLILGIAILAIVLWDIFETIILPRRVTRRFRLARFYYRMAWQPFAAVMRRIRIRNRRETLLGFFGPLSLLGLFAVWAIGLIFGFALVQYALGSPVSFPAAQGMHAGFWADLYLSGSTIFTLGLGDVVPTAAAARVVIVIEAGIGLGFLALAISYLPTLYTAFSRREANISLLDARAGSPPSASELVIRHTQPHGAEALEQYLRGWETWAADLMESHLSYPVLCYFRSQHSNQSWLAALTTMLDTSALLVAYGNGSLQWQANLTFAISRHAVADLAQVLSAAPRPFDTERLPPDELERLKEAMRASGLAEGGKENDDILADLRAMYEPFVNVLSNRLLMPVGPWTADKKRPDNWRTSAWARVSALPTHQRHHAKKKEKDHF
jgi:hypothetical protein